LPWVRLRHQSLRAQSGSQYQTLRLILHLLFCLFDFFYNNKNNNLRLNRDALITPLVATQKIIIITITTNLLHRVLLPLFYVFFSCCDFFFTCVVQKTHEKFLSCVTVFFHIEIFSNWKEAPAHHPSTRSTSFINFNNTSLIQ